MSSLRPRKGRVYLQIQNGAQIDRVAKEQEKVKLTFYPTASYSDEPVTVYLQSQLDGSVLLLVRVARKDGTNELVFEKVIDQPASRGEA